MSKRRAFTAVETLLTLGIISVTAGFTVPMYRNFQIRSDLDLVTEQTIQGLRRAQILAQSGENDSSWGFFVQDGVIYQGEAYAVRDPQYDESYPVPATINTSGLPEVSFSRIDGAPNQTGEIIIQGLSGDQRIIIVGIDGVLSSTGIEGGGEGGGSGSGSGGGSSGGGTSSSGGSSGGGTSSSGGSSGGGTSSSGGSSGGETSSSGGSSSGGTGSSSGGGGDTPGPACEDRFTVGDDGVITTTGNVNATFEVLGSEITYGSGGPEVQVRVYASTNGGTTWVPLFNEEDVDGGETQAVLNIPNGSQVLLKVKGRYSWLFNRTYISNSGDGHIEVLRDGDTPPAYDAFDNQEDLSTFLSRVIGSDGNISIGTYDAIFLAELGGLGTSSADFQDAVVKVTFNQPEGSCASTSEPRFNVSFSRVENVGNKSDAQNKVFVGEQGMIFADSEWIPLADNGQVILDNFLTEDVPGLAAWRHSGYIRVLLHGSLFDGSREVVDATITLQNATITSIENDTGNNATESPFNGIVNDGPLGDEVTTAADNQSVLFQTRVTIQDDAILIHWAESAGAGTTDGTTGGTTDGTTDGTTGGTTDGTTDGDTDSGGGDLDDDTPDPCGVAYTIKDNGQIEINEPADVTFRAIGSHITYGTRGPEVRAYASASFDGGAGWQSLFSFRDIDGGERETFTDVASGSKLAVRAEGRYSWLFRNRTDTVDGTGRVKVLKRKDPLPGTTPFANVPGLRGFMRNVIDVNRINISKTSLLMLFELQELNADSDHQDVAIEVILEKPASQGICGTESDDDSDSGSSSSAEGTGTSSSTSSDTGSTGGTGDTGGDTGGETGQTTTVCHFPPGNRGNPHTLEISVSGVQAHLAHGDREGACESDADGDTIPNSQDLCGNTYMPEGVPRQFMLFRRFALTTGSPIFRKGPRKKIGQFTLSHTRGCSCEQLIDVAENKKDYHFSQFPRLQRQVRSLFPFYTRGAREYGCGKAIVNMVKNF